MGEVAFARALDRDFRLLLFERGVNHGEVCEGAHAVAQVEVVNLLDVLLRARVALPGERDGEGCVDRVALG